MRPSERVRERRHHELDKRIGKNKEDVPRFLLKRRRAAGNAEGSQEEKIYQLTNLERAGVDHLLKENRSK